MATITPERIVLRHLSGSKSNQVEEFPLKHFKELTIGRTATSDVKYDPDKDDLVSRQQATITQDQDDPTQFTITDLESRNGTFVNKQRIIGLARIVPGDVIQMGPGGPEFEFDLEPRPDSLMRRTRLAGDDAAAVPVRSTREGGVPASAREASVSGTAAHTSVGRTTVERLITYTRNESQRLMLFGGSGLFVLLIMITGVMVWRGQENTGEEIDRTRDEIERAEEQREKERPLNAAQIAAANVDKVVLIEMSWKLILTETGGQIYHRYVPQQQKDQQGGEQTVCRAAYYQSDKNEIVPWLSLDAKTIEGGSACSNQAITGSGTGSGFVVGSDGFVMTNRHVAAGWHHGYHFPQHAVPGMVFGYDQKGQMQVVGVIEQAPGNWIPAKAVDKQPLMQGKVLEGRLDYLDVTFAKNEQRWPAQLVGVNQSHDVAMIKVNIPELLPAATLNDNYDAIQPGEAITIMGYPGISPSQLGGTQSNTFDQRGREFFTIPDPTTTPGTIGRVIRGQQVPAGGTRDDFYSTMGDYYQLTASETGAGNSGGPVFDDRGRVIGIFTASMSRANDARITFAVPIRHGMKLMGRQQVVQ